MKVKTRTYLAPASLILLAASLACANTRGAETGGGGGDGGGGGEEVATPTPLPAGATLSASGLEGQLYIGTFEPPEEGYAAFCVHDDFALDMLAVHTGRITWSVYMTGTLEGQRVDLDEENGRARVSGRPGDRVHVVRAGVIVNCAGPWVDRVRDLAGVSDAGKRVLRTTKGIHCMLPRMTERAVYLSTAD